MRFYNFASKFLFILFCFVLVFLLQTKEAHTLIFKYNSVFQWNIQDDATGGDCTAIGAWDTVSKTCILSTDLIVNEDIGGIVLDSDYLTLDGGGHTLSNTFNGNNFRDGVFSRGNRNITIRNLIVTGFNHGILLQRSTSGLIENNIAERNSYGISVGWDNTRNNIITNNSIRNNFYFGIQINLDSTSGGFQLTNNIMIGNGFNLGGLPWLSSGNNIDTSNLVNGKPLYYVEDATNVTYDETTNAGAFYCIRCSNVTIKNITPVNPMYAIFFGGTRDSRVENTNITNSSIVVYNSPNNVFTNNTISSSGRVGGISFFHLFPGFPLSSGNKVYNNNFIGSRVVDFDGGNFFSLPSPTGGNYFSNFDEPLEGCHDIDANGFCDAPFVFSILIAGELKLRQDNLPWTKKDGWLTPPNQPPTLSFPTADSYTENGINPNKGTVETEFIFKTVYTDADNDPPQNISLIIGDGAATTTRALAVDASAPIELRDGNYANGEQFTATSTFSKKAKYFYHFEASDEKGSIARLPETEELNFSVNQSPVALFTFTPQIPKVDEDIIFDASSSYDPDSQLIRYEWDWDNDGEYDDSSELATMTMRWPLSGSFVVRLRVIDDSGVEANSTTSLLVSGTARSELAALIIFAFIDVGNTLFWQNIAFDTPIIKHLFPSYREFKKIDEWLRKDAIGNVSGNPLDWIKNDQRFEEFSQYITYADIITLLHENIPETNITYEDRIRTIIFEYQIADYALQRGFRTETGYRQAMRTFKEIGKQLVKWIPIIGDLITGDSFDEVVLKETIKRGTKVALKEILIRKVFEEMSAEELSESGVNYVWMAYKIYSGIRNLNNEANIQTYENRLASYFACLNPLIGGNQAFCWQQTKNVDNNSSIPVLADEDEVEFMQLWKKYGDNSSAGNIHGISQVKLEELQDIVKVIVLDALEQYKNKVPNRLYADINSPVEMRIIDQDGVAVGVVDGVVKEDIPRSVYNQEDEAITIILPPTDISFQLVGTADETYEFIVTSIENGIVGKFKSIDIPTNKGIVHKYNIDWQALFRGEKGVTVEVDENGDGIIDYQFKTSSKLEDKTSPTTQILLAGKSGINNWYTTDVTVTFTAEDNADGGVGVRRTEYSLDNGTTWQNYIVPLILTQESIHTLLYRSIDFLGNIENIHSQTIKIDKTSPEAKIFFDQNLKQLNIEGIDNLSSVAVVQNGNNYTLTDEAGHTLVIAFDKLKTEGKEIKAEISALRYDGIPIPAIPKNKLQYEWSLEKNGDIKELNQRIEIEKNFDVHAHYDAKKDKTKVDAKIEDKEDEKKIQQTIPGLTILILTTNFGNFFVDY